MVETKKLKCEKFYVYYNINITYLVKYWQNRVVTLAEDTDLSVRVDDETYFEGEPAGSQFVRDQTSL